MYYSQAHVVPYTPYAHNIYWQNPYYSSLYNPYFKNDSRYTYQIPYLRCSPNGVSNVRPTHNVDVTVFNESAQAFKQLMHDASIILNRLADSKQFAAQVMGAAQKSNTEEVNRLIQSTGIQSNIEVSYNPDGIHLKLWSEVKGTECCKLDMAIRWQ